MVSIIIPVYKVEKYIRCCLNSILSQTYTDYEVIMVDDGSPDKSAIICEEFTSKDTRFKLIRQDNKGLASARNTGIKNAKGEYIFFIDSDDCVNSKLLEILVDISKRENANIVQVAYKDVPSNFEEYNEQIDNEILYNSIQHITALQGMYQLEINKTAEQRRKSLCTTVVWNKLYRASAFESLLFPEGMRMHEDQMVAHRNIIDADGMIFVDYPLYYYRKVEGSLIREGWTSKRLSILDCYDNRLDYVKKINATESEKERLINYIYYRYLVCIFRNYDMADRKLVGKEKTSICDSLIIKMKHVYKQNKKSLKVIQRIAFGLFMKFPHQSIALCRIRDKFIKR